MYTNGISKYLHHTAHSASAKKGASTLRLHLLALLAFMVSGGLLARHLGQDLNWDLMNYHWYNPWAFLHGRLGYDIEPAWRMTYVNPLLDLPTYLLRAHLQPVTAGVILGAFQALNGWLVFEIALLLLRKYVRPYRLLVGVALVTGFLSLCGAASLSEIGNSMGENIVSLFVLAALLLLLLSFNRPTPKAAFTLRIAAYFLAGIAVGLKLTSFMYIIPLLLCGLLIDARWKIRIRDGVLHGMAVFGGILFSAGYWYVQVWHMFGNPIFPFYNAIFKSPYYPAVNFSEHIWFPQTLAQKIFFPFTFAHLPTDPTKPFFRDPRLAVLFVLFFAAIAYWLVQRKFVKGWPALRFNRPEWAFIAFIVISYLLWETLFSYYRYLLPVELLSLTFIALLVYKLIPRMRLATILLAILFGFISLYTVHSNWGRIPWQPDNFGPDLYTQLSGVDGTVLMVPKNPIAFLVPYLPAKDRAISIDDYDGITPKQRALIESAIDKDTANHRAFYAIQTANGVEESGYLKKFGFVTTGCTPIKTYVGTYLYDGALQYNVCTLQRVSD